MVQSDIDQSRITAGLLNAGADLGPEKLTMHKLKTLEEQQDTRSEAGDLPKFGARSSVLRHGGMRNFSGAASVAGGGSRHMATRTSRLVTGGGSRRQSSFLANHRSRMSSDLAAHAESKFFAMMEMMTSASREASSFKEYWQSLMEDRESFDRERESLLLQLDEVTTQLETRDEEYDNRQAQTSGKDTEIEKLLVLINTSKDATADHERKLVERESELDRSRKDNSQLQAKFSSLQFHHDTYKSDLEARNLQLRETVLERDNAIRDVERQRSEYRTLARENSELKSKVTDLLAQLEASRKEVALLTERTRSLETERTELLHNQDRLQDDLKRAIARHSETTRELQELTDRYDAFQRDVNRIKETLRATELERDEHLTALERLRYEVKDKTTRLSDVETQNTDISLRLEQSKREVTSVNEKLSSVTIEITTLKTQLDDRHDQLRLVNTERDNLKDDVETERRNVLDVKRQVTNMQDQHTRTESIITELRSETLKLNETIRETERTRDEARHRHGPFEKEIAILKEKLALALTQNGEMINARDNARKELDDYRCQYEEITESMTEYNNESQELQYEIESLRALLSESREQREVAISARNAADRERDNQYAMYNAKCRELEKFEEQKILEFRQLQQQSEAAKQASTSRTFSTRTVMHGGGHSSSEAHGGAGGHHHHHSHGHAHGNGDVKNDEEL